MSACAKCRGSMAEVFYTRAGDAVCRACYWSDQREKAEERAAEAAYDEDDPRMVAERAAEAERAPEPATPAKAFAAGGVLLALAALAVAIQVHVDGEIGKEPFAIVLIAIWVFMEGFRMRKQE